MQVLGDYLRRPEVTPAEKRAERRYPMLDTIAIVQKTCAGFLLVMGLVGGAVTLVFSPRNWAVGAAFIGASIVQFVLLWACAELIYVFVDIEANTRSILLIEQNTRIIARKGLAELLLGSDLR